MDLRTIWILCGIISFVLEILYVKRSENKLLYPDLNEFIFCILFGIISLITIIVYFYIYDRNKK